MLKTAFVHDYNVHVAMQCFNLAVTMYSETSKHT